MVQRNDRGRFRLDKVYVALLLSSRSDIPGVARAYGKSLNTIHHSLIQIW